MWNAKMASIQSNANCSPGACAEKGFQLLGLCGSLNMRSSVFPLGAHSRIYIVTSEVFFTFLSSALGKFSKHKTSMDYKLTVEREKRVIIELVCSSSAPINALRHVSFMMVANTWKMVFGTFSCSTANGHWKKKEARSSALIKFGFFVCYLNILLHPAR